MYKLRLSKTAEKSLRKLPHFVVKGFEDKFTKLAQNPYQMSGVETITNPKSIGMLVDKAY